jgi:hypothetical protein
MSESGINHFSAAAIQSPVVGSMAFWSDLTVSGSDGGQTVLVLADHLRLAAAAPPLGMPWAAKNDTAAQQLLIKPGLTPTPQTVPGAQATGISLVAMPGKQAEANRATDATAMLDFALGLADLGIEEPVAIASSVVPEVLTAQPPDTPALDPASDEACAKAFDAALAAAMAADARALDLETSASLAQGGTATAEPTKDMNSDNGSAAAVVPIHPVTTSFST